MHRLYVPVAVPVKLCVRNLLKAKYRFADRAVFIHMQAVACTVETSTAAVC